MTAAHSPRVLFLLSSLSVGGSEKKTIRIANALANQGWQVSIAHLDGIHDLRPQISVRVEVIFLERSGKFSIGALRRLVAYIRRSHVDVLCCINLYSLIYGFLSKILVFRSFKLIATSNATEFVRRKDELKMFLYAPMLRRANAVVFGSEFQAELWTKNYRLDPARCTYIYNGVDLEYFDVPGSSSDALETRRKLGIPASAFVFGSIGTFRREKQYQMAIRTCIRLRQEKGLDAYCLLVGGGFKEAELKALVAELDCKRYVLLLESVDDVRPYLSAMDVFVLTSISETFSNAALEAMATRGVTQSRRVP